MFPDISCDDIFRLETSRLWLRWLRATDAQGVAAFCGLAAVAAMTAAIPHPYPPGEAERFILHARASTAGGDALVLAVTAKTSSQARSRAAVAHPPASQALLGIVSAQAAGHGEIEIGYLIAPAQGGRGYATEATAALADAVFNLTEARALVASSRVDNPASRRVLEKCGFSHVETRPHYLPARGATLPCEFFRRERGDWLRGRMRRLPGMAQQVPRTAARPAGDDFA